ncbi:MAG: hypothetical protein JO198_10450 [Candidatus Dormibacteraeota bacterium]|nr:hypothetical protein [Candidatus Dormibacteraeota bacterium]
MFQGSRSRRIAVVAVCGAAALGASQVTARAAGPYGGTAQNGFTTPVALGSSGGLGEPTIIHDSANRLFVTAPQGIGNVNTGGGSPLFTSTNGGATWGAPVRSQECTGLSGGDTDLAVDGSDNVFQTDLWLGGSCLSVSTDHGGSFTAGNPLGTHPAGFDDRPWLAYNKISNQIYAIWDGGSSINYSYTASGQPPQAVQMVGPGVVVPESAINTSGTPDSVRECVCPPGGIAADNTTGAHSGRVYVSYSYQHGTAISYGDLTGTCPACTVTSWTGPVAIPGSDTGTGSVSAFEDEWNFDPIKVDGNGTLYVMWAHAYNFNTTAGTGGVQMFYSYSTTGGTTWHGPIKLSTLTGTTTFPTMDVVAPGVLDAAWYGDPSSTTTDPNTVPTTDTWNVYYTRVTGADTDTPTISPEIAVSGMHTGCIQTGGNGANECTDRSLLDFFTLTDDTCGNPNVIYTGGDVTNGVQLYFTKLTVTQCSAVTAETPWAPLLLLPGSGIAVFALRRRSRRRATALAG